MNGEWRIGTVWLLEMLRRQLWQHNGGTAFIDFNVGELSKRLWGPSCVATVTVHGTGVSLCLPILVQRGSIPSTIRPTVLLIASLSSQIPEAPVHAYSTTQDWSRFP